MADRNEEGGIIKIEMNRNEKREAPALDAEDADKQKKPGLVFDRLSENLIEISLVFAGLRTECKSLSDIDSITWKQMFADWANEFETIHAGTDWDQEDYLDEIEKYARQKILEYAGLEDIFTV